MKKLSLCLVILLGTNLCAMKRPMLEVYPDTESNSASDEAKHPRTANEDSDIAGIETFAREALPDMSTHDIEAQSKLLQAKQYFEQGIDEYENAERLLADIVDTPATEAEAKYLIALINMARAMSVNDSMALDEVMDRSMARWRDNDITWSPIEFMDIAFEATDDPILRTAIGLKLIQYHNAKIARHQNEIHKITNELTNN